MGNSAVFPCQSFPSHIPNWLHIWHSDRLPSSPPGTVLEKTQLGSLEKNPSWAGSIRPCEGPAGSPPAYRHCHMSGTDSEKQPPGAAVVEPRGSWPLILPSLPPLAPHLQLYQDIRYFQKEPPAPLLGMPFLPPCPQTNSCSPFKTQLESPLLHPVLWFSLADWTAPLCVPPLSCIAKGLQARSIRFMHPLLR